MRYFIGLRKDKRTGQWTWLSNGKSLNATRGEFPWAYNVNVEGLNCVTMSKDFDKKIGWFVNIGCYQTGYAAGSICEGALACKYDKGRLMK